MYFILKTFCKLMIPIHTYDFSSNVLHFICLQNHFWITYKANSAVNDISKSMFDVLLSFDNQFSLSCSLIVSLKSLHLSDSLMIKFYYKFRAHFYSSLYSWYNMLIKEHIDSHNLTMKMSPITGYWRWNSQGSRRYWTYIHDRLFEDGRKKDDGSNGKIYDNFVEDYWRSEKVRT